MKKILLVDGFSILNRAFYALPPLTTSAGVHTGAVFGFMNILMRFLDEEKPDFITVAWDLPVPTFRHERYGAYKGTRRAMPDELREQVPTLKNLLAKMNLLPAECEGYEADDIIGTLAVQAEAQGIRAVIVSGDRDMLQLATDTVCVRLPKTKSGKTEVETYFAADVLERYGVTPTAYIDVKALMGDTSDNIPGVPGIGEVTATKIIAAYGTLENAIAHAADIKPKKAAENLAEFAEQARISQMLAAIVTDAPVTLALSSTAGMWNMDALAEIMRLELKQLARRMQKEMADGRNEMISYHSDKSAATDIIGNVTTPDAAGDITTNDTAGGITVTTVVWSGMTVEIINSLPDATEIFNNLIHAEYNNKKNTAFYTLWDNAELIGMGICAQHRSTDFTPYYFAVGESLCAADLLQAAKPWLESSVPKFTHDFKTERQRLLAHGISLRGVTFDAMLAAYALDTQNAEKSLPDLAHSYTGIILPTSEDLLANKGKRSTARQTFSDLLPQICADFAGAYAQALVRMQPVLTTALEENGLLDLYKDIELPLASVLADMEQSGIRVDRDVLTESGKSLAATIAELSAQIHTYAGEEFNIQSPIQLGAILFEKLGLRGGKKTKQGYSTAADILEKLRAAHPIVGLVLAYRAHAKLKSTYIDGLLPLIHPETQRIRSTFRQALTATGRLSSAEPNLQNIPVRTEMGRVLRKAFVPQEGCVFVDADYNQIELRVLAHMSGDEVLIQAFRENADIHRLTASQVHGIAPEAVTPAQRSNAKAVNFGIVYGISAFGLSEDLGIPVWEAEDYIAAYFIKYPLVKKFMNDCVTKATETGYATTLFNRRRSLPELKAHNHNIRQFGARVAMNMPIQGTAADLIKIAMIRVSERLQSEKLSARLILQVHDELLLEVPYNELETVKKLVKTEMENAATLAVPLTVDVHSGESWYETK